MTTLMLENERYKLFMRGSIHKWVKTGTSDHYYDYEEHYYQWRGEGVVVDNKTDKSTQFSFNSPDSRNRPPTLNLESLVLEVQGGPTVKVEDRPGISHYRLSSVRELALPNQNSNIVNFVCVRLLDKVAGCANPIKTIIIDPIPIAELINAGIVADSSGQICLNIIVGTRN